MTGKIVCLVYDVYHLASQPQEVI